MEYIVGIISLISLIVFFVTCDTIAKIKDNQKKLLEFLEQQALKQEKHQQYIEKHIYTIKDNTIKSKQQ
jgi:uncharacterized membrane protein